MRYAFDTNIWRYALTRPAFAVSLREQGFRAIGLPAVVAHELLRGARTPELRSAIQSAIARWSHALLAPSAADWIRAAGLVAGPGIHDPETRTRLQNDALIAASCARVGWAVVTANRRDFERLAREMGRSAPAMIYVAAPG